MFLTDEMKVEEMDGSVVSRGASAAFCYSSALLPSHSHDVAIMLELIRR